MPTISDIPLQYDSPSPSTYTILKDQSYKTLPDQTDLKFDLFRPTNRPSRGTIIFVHGEAPPDEIMQLKNWRHLPDWAALTANGGFDSLLFQHRSSHWFSQLDPVKEDVTDFLNFVRHEASDLDLNLATVRMWVCSGATPIALRGILESQQIKIDRLALYYPRMSYTEIAHEIKGISPEALLEYDGTNIWNAMPPERRPKLHMVRAGQESKPEINQSIDRFLSEILQQDSAIDLELFTHPAGGHFFDLFANNHKTKQLIEHTLSFLIGD